MQNVNVKDERYIVKYGYVDNIPRGDFLNLRLYRGSEP
jgi:hypothetical protein